MSFSGAGSGTIADPYIITTVEQLQEMQNDLAAHYALGKDIDASDTRHWNDGAGFIPIGLDSDPFIGSFDGRDKTISNLYINGGAERSALFYEVSGKAVLKNFTLEDMQIRTEDVASYLTAGIPAPEEGDSFVEVENVHIRGGTVEARVFCVVAPYVNVPLHAKNITVEATLNLGTGEFGGFVRNVFPDFGRVVFENCSFNGSVASTKSVTGFSEYAHRADFLNCSVSGEFSAGTALYGFARVAEEATIKNCEVNANLIGFDEVCGFFNNLYGETRMDNCTFEGDISVLGYGIAAGLGAYDSYEGTCIVTNCHFRGNIVSSGPAAPLVYSSNGVIENCSAEGAVRSDGMNACGLVSLNFGSVSSSSSTCSVQSSGVAGGLVANNYGIVQNSLAAGDVKGSYDVGGFVGANYGTIECCFATGEVLSNGNAGGFVGSDYGELIYGSFSTGLVTGGEQVGGLVGASYTGLIENCYSTSSVSATKYAAGLIGFCPPTDLVIRNCFAAGLVEGELAGGLVSSPVSETATIESSYWDIEATGQSNSLGGIGKTTAEMKRQDTFVGWDFDEVWQIQGDSYPRLRFFPDDEEDDVVFYHDGDQFVAATIHYHNGQGWQRAKLSVRNEETWK